MFKLFPLIITPTRDLGWLGDVLGGFGSCVMGDEIDPRGFGW